MKTVVVFLALSVLPAGAQSMPTRSQIAANEEQIWSLLEKGDLASFGNTLAPDFINVTDAIYNRQQTLDQNAQCKLNSFMLGEMQVRILSEHSYFVAYPMSYDDTCGLKDRPQHDAGNFYASTIWVRKDASAPWKIQAHHQSALIPAK